VQRRALIVGGSMSGLLAALMLRRRGWEADIYERVAGELAGRGAGIVAQPSLIAHLKALGLDTSELGVPIARRQMLDREGRVTLTASTGCCAMPFRSRITTAAESSHRSSKRRAESLPAFPTAASRRATC
jgi:2-polyprenyl-6-methoxyphenol hydroxylase-like FAD-dependent oxidoreductase